MLLELTSQLKKCQSLFRGMKLHNIAIIASN